MSAGYVVGQSYHDAYWRRDYTVTAVDGDRISVAWEDGTTGTHMTAFDPRDIPFTGVCPLGDARHGDALRNRSNGWGRS